MRGRQSTKIMKSNQVQACTMEVNKHGSTSKNHIKLKTEEKWMRLTPMQSSRCLVITYEISWSCDKIWEFHKRFGNVYHMKSTNDHIWKKILNQMENRMINSKKIHTQTRHVKDHSCKIWGHLDARKHVNKIRENAWSWYDTKCNL